MSFVLSFSVVWIKAIVVNFVAKVGAIAIRQFHSKISDGNLTTKQYQGLGCGLLWLG